MIHSHQPSWNSCCQHSQQISMLQDKIMQIHSKLIDQLDVCREQELTIIQLNLKLNENNKHKNIQFDTFKDQSFGQHRYQSQKQNSIPNFNYSKDNSQVKNQLLKADLQAMRNKVLMQITQKNNLKQELKQLKISHKKQISFQTKKYQGLQSMFRKLQAQHENLLQKHERLKKDQSQDDKITYKINDLQQKYLKQKENNKKLDYKNRQLMEELQYLKVQNKQSYEKDNKTKDNKAKDKVYSNVVQNMPSYSKKSNQNGSKIQKYSINQLQRQLQLRDNRQKRYNEQRSDWSDSQQDPRLIQDKRYVENKRHVEFNDLYDKQEKFDDKKKKRGFQETKQLIKKLQQAEISMRKNRKQIS